MEKKADQPKKNQSKNTTKGLFFKELIKVYKQAKKHDLLKALEKKLGTLEFSAFKNYSAEMDNQFQKIVCETLYGKETKEAHFELGKIYHWKVVENSVITKTIFTLAQNDPAKILPMFAKLNDAFTSGMTAQCKVEGNKAILRIQNYPYWPEHYQGILYGGIEFLGYKPKIVYDLIGDREVEFVIEWEK